MFDSEIAVTRQYTRAAGEAVLHDLKRNVEQLFTDAQPRVYLEPALCEALQDLGHGSSFFDVARE